LNAILPPQQLLTPTPSSRYSHIFFYFDSSLGVFLLKYDREAPGTMVKKKERGETAKKITKKNLYQRMQPKVGLLEYSP